MSLIPILLGLRPHEAPPGRRTIHRMPVKPRRPIVDAPDHEDTDEDVAGAVAAPRPRTPRSTVQRMQERRARVLALLRETGEATATTVANCLDSNAAYIDKDLRALERDGKVEKRLSSHGARQVNYWRALP